MSSVLNSTFELSSESQAEDAVLARLSYAASIRAHELAQRLANKLTAKQVAKIAACFSVLVRCTLFSFLSSP